MPVIKIFILTIALSLLQQPPAAPMRALVLPVPPASAIQLDTPLDAAAIQDLLREVEANHKAANEKLKYFSYTIKRTEHQLNDEGVGNKYRIHEYRVFPQAFGAAVSAMLSENEAPLPAAKLAKEKGRANKEWQKWWKKSQQSDNKDKKASDQKPKPPWYEGLSFTALPGERLDDRDMMVLGFRPRADYSAKETGDKFMSGLQGQIWVDPVEKMIWKFQAELTTNVNPGGLSGWLSSLKPGTTITIENTRAPNGMWVVKRFDFSTISKERGSLLPLSRTARFRYVDEMSDYRPFDPAATDLFKE